VKLSPRQWLAVVLLAIFVYISISLAPPFVDNLRLQRYVEEITRSSPITPRSPEEVRSQVVQRARQLGMPVEAKDVQVEIAGARTRITVRYLVEVSIPGYTVKLHFAPSAGS
jgi:hypothetical protein